MGLSMKIGLVCPYSIARGGAVQEIVRAQRVELVKRGHDVRIIAPQPRDISDVDLTGVIFVGSANDFRSPMGTTTAVSSSFDDEALVQMLETEKFDVLHFHEPWQPFLSRQILMRSKSVNIATFHAKIPETLMSRTIVRVVTPYTKSVLKYLHELTGVSDAAVEYVSTLTDQSITIIPNAIDLKHYKPATTRPNKAADEPKTILFVGRLERRKGVKYLLQAYQLLVQEEDNVRLVIAGDGPSREKLENLTDELGLRNVSFLGYVDDETKLELMQTADLVCAPAIFGESFGIVLLEAMACGAVLVAGDNSGYASVMRDTGAMSLVNPHDSVDFARRLQLLLRNEELRKVWLKWAKEYVKQFSYERIMDQYEELYEAAVKEHGRRLIKA
jgi:phosphatidylinositol alpha-mannosyltransferase